MNPPTIGKFKDGRGELYDRETFNARAILVRLVISDIKPDSCRFEQAFSEDDGKTWEVNWIAIDTRTCPNSKITPFVLLQLANRRAQQSLDATRGAFHK